MGWLLDNEVVERVLPDEVVGAVVEWPLVVGVDDHVGELEEALHWAV